MIFISAFRKYIYNNNIFHFFTTQQESNYSRDLAFPLHKSLQTVSESILDNTLELSPAKTTKCLLVLTHICLSAWSRLLSHRFITVMDVSLSVAVRSLAKVTTIVALDSAVAVL